MKLTPTRILGLLKSYFGLGGSGTGAATFSGSVTFSSYVASPLPFNAAAGAASSVQRRVVKKTGMGDGSAVDFVTVTVPNGNHAAAIRVTLLASNGGSDAFESSRCAEGMVVLARTTGANVVAVAATLELAQIATVSLGATHTLAYGVSSITGAVGATNTFTITVTVNDSGNVGSNQCVMVAELINAESSGVTFASA